MTTAPRGLAEAKARMRLQRIARDGRLREMRESAGLSQSDVARAIGVDPSNVSRYEASQQQPRGPRALALLALLEGHD